MVKKGETFNISLVAVDQVNRPVDANIISSLVSPNGGFGEGQHTQAAGKNCSNLTYNVFSLRDYESINLHAGGPCGGSKLSVQKLNIQFLNCTCPVGFQPSNTEPTSCQCICDPDLSPYITDCNLSTGSIVRKGTNSWITYVSDTDPPGYVIFIVTALLTIVNLRLLMSVLISIFLMEQMRSVLTIVWESYVELVRNTSVSP